MVMKVSVITPSWSRRLGVCTWGSDRVGCSIYQRHENNEFPGATSTASLITCTFTLLLRFTEVSITTSNTMTVDPLPNSSTLPHSLTQIVAERAGK
jgi:hypothetical protein